MSHYPKRRPKPYMQYPKRKQAGGWDQKNYDWYNSRPWRRMSKTWRRRNPQCWECELDGEVGPADVTDHTIPVEHGGAWIDPDNFGSLCHRHHNRKSAMEKKKPIYQWKLNKNGEKIPKRGRAGKFLRA